MMKIISTAKECGKSSKLYVTCCTLGVGQFKCLCC